MDKSTKRLFVISVLIAIIGLFVLYSASSQSGLLREKNIFFRQLIWVSLGAVSFMLFSNFNYRRLYDFSFILYGLSLIFLIAVLIFGRSRLGAQRWLEVGNLSFQPSELAKFSVIIFLARYLSRKDTFNVKLKVRDLGLFKSFIAPGLVAVVPAVLVLEQPDLGTAAMFIFVFFAMIFFVGIKKRYIFSLLLTGVAMLPIFWFFLKDYQRERLLVFMDPNLDPLGAGYTIIQSKIAAGSGGMFGRGWLSGTQNTLNFLPERHTDFIFSCLAESYGFLGSMLVLFLFYLLLKECINIIYATRDPFGRLLAAGIITVIFLQVVINISMTIGFFPVVGLPLPLVSYGGTSMLVTFMGLGIIASINKRRMIF